MSAVRDDNHRLTQTVTELRADRRAQDRKIKDLEHQLALSRDAATEVPKLPVEVVAPSEPKRDDQRIVGVADDGSPIIYEGEAITGRSVTAADDEQAPLPGSPPAPTTAAADDDRISVTHAIPPMSARPARTRAHADVAPLVDAAGPEYRAAVELVKAARYPDAIVALRAFLQHYPRHDYADNAQYWLGEAFYAQHDYPHALVEFRATIETYPRGNKVPDALLKVGFCYQALGKLDKMRAVLEQVVNLYPKSEPAAIAAKKLESP